MVAGRSTDLPVADHHIVMARTRGLDAHLPQYQQHHVDEAVEGEVHILLGGDERPHEIVHVGIHTAAPTLASIEPDAMGTAVIDIHLVLQYLVAPEDHTRRHLPQEEAVGLIEMTRHILLHRQIERQATNL